MTTGVETPRCKNCARRDDLIIGDGHVVCRSCVKALGELAANPEQANDAVIAEMMKRHGDVVQIIRVGRPGGRPSRLEWDWIGWP